MYLEKLEIQGFKSFAKRTVVAFPARAETKHSGGIAAIVGPNGSGKSNIADAIRWVLGEQSLKLLRGKKSEDIIFSGSGKLPRLGFAEVVLFLNNEDNSIKLDYSHISIARRLYRNGDSEYLINGSQVRLTDVHLLLAQANVGQRTYSVIGQGMVDTVLVSQPEERKNFFDEATGVKQYQIKREQARQKIETATANLAQTENSLREISPRLKYLERQRQRLEKRTELEQKLRDLQAEYYGSRWQKINFEVKKYKEENKKFGSTHLALVKELQELQHKLKELETTEDHTEKDALGSLEQNYLAAINKKNELETSLVKLEYQCQAQQTKSNDAISGEQAKELLKLARRHIDLLKKLSSTTTIADLQKLQNEINSLKNDTEEVVKKLGNDNNATNDKKNDTLEIQKIKTELTSAQTRITQLQSEFQKARQKEQKDRTEIFRWQKQYQTVQNELNQIIGNKNQIAVTLASVSAHLADLEQEMARELPADLHQSIKNSTLSLSASSAEELWPKITRAKHELELTAGIDPDTDKEYQETKERYEFLNTQTTDLRNGLEKTLAVAQELDKIISIEFNKNFNLIAGAFSEYFGILFAGGKASLETHCESGLEAISEETAAELTEKEKKELAGKKKIGIEIKAVPPGKKLTNINILSGGERALTAIALICAIIKANPAPFVVLDEVDAALDESNSARFAAILEKLSSHTQFIAITHNRATMEKATVLYGVTMSDDGVSKLLSVNLEKAMQTVAK